MTDDDKATKKPKGSFDPKNTLDELWEPMVERMRGALDKTKPQRVECQCGKVHMVPFADVTALTALGRFLAEHGYGKPGASHDTDPTPDLDIDYAAMTPEDKTAYRQRLIKLASPHLLSALSGD